jgi:hypothetical protein
MTLEQMIQKAVNGDSVDREMPITKTASAGRTVETVSESEKLATTLEFIGRRGVENMLKEAEHLATNHGVHHANHRQSTVRHHSGAPSMGDESPGLVGDNRDSRPGGSAEQAKPRGDGQTHHSALSSNSAAIGFDKREKAKQVDGDLSALFDAKPFADKKLKENLTGAAGKGDKNIHVKTAADKELLRQAIQKKIAAGEK